jgi:hypothetical protein
MKSTAALVGCAFALVSLIEPGSLEAGHKCPRGGSVCCCYRETKHQGWQALESQRFRIHYACPQSEAAGLVTFCEETCEALRQKWIGSTGHAWSCKCDVYLYPTAKAFEKGARAPAATWGLADLEVGQGRVWKRRLHLRTDVAEKLKPVLTHEMTHVVLAEHFCSKPIPRWADEGIAVFSEPRERQQQMLTLLKEEASVKRLIPLGRVTSSTAAPRDERETDLFYGQSGAVIEYLMTVRQLNEKQVLAFVGLCADRGWDRAISSTWPGTTAAQFEAGWRDWVAQREEDAATVKVES